MKKVLSILLIAIGVFTYQSISAQSCDTLRNYSISDDFYEISGDYGALLGHDKIDGGATNVTQWAEPYSVSAPTEVRRLVFVPWVVHDEGGSVTFNVYQNNAGVPGTVLGSETVALADINEYFLTEIDFSSPVTVNGDFFVGYELEYNTPQDTFAILGTFKPGGTNFTQMFSGGVWENVDDNYLIGSDPLISAWELDVLCSNAPDPIADFTIDGLTACMGGEFTMDGTPSQNVDQYIWGLTGPSLTPIYDTDQGVSGTLIPTTVGNDQEITLIADGGCKSHAVYATVEVFDDVSATVGTVSTTCGLDNGIINITSPTGGSGTYSYSIDNGSTFQSNGNYTGLASGSYNVVVNTGGNGCSYTETVSVGATAQETITVGTDQTICAGETATITASGTGTIEWFDGATSVGNGTSITVSPTTTTTYDAVLTDGNGCEDVDQVVVNVNALPAIDAGTNDAICIGDSYTLTATGGDTYDWDNGLGAGGSHSVSPATTTTYEVTGTDANGCINTDQVEITVNALPTIDAGTNQTSCAGAAVTISATGASSYDWDNSLGTGASHVVSPTVTTIYEVTGTDANGCVNTDNVTITVNALPSVDAGADIAICAGANTTLTATGADSYTWDNGLGAGASHSVTPSATTTYEVTGTDANNCTNTATVQVTVNPIDDASFTFNDYCEVAPTNGPTGIATTGGTFAFNPVVTDGATIDASSGEISNGVTGTTYTVEYTTNGTCPNSSTETVTVQTNDDPSFDYADICIGNGLPIEPSNISTTGGTFDFVTTPTDGATIDGSTGVISDATQGSSYTVEYTTPTGVCQASSTVTVEVFNAPTIVATGGQTICEEDQVTLNATGGDTYSWDNSLGNGATHVVSPSTTTTYIVTGTDANGCTNTDNVTVTVNPLPTVDAGLDQEVCEGENVNISASGATSYDWDNGLGAGATQSFTAASTTTYTVTGTDGNNCINTDEVVITVNPLPNVDAGADQAICNGDQITITANGANTYNWNNSLGAGAAHNISPAATTTYEVVGTDLNGCENTDEVTVTVNSIPTINAGVDQEVCEGEQVTLTATASSGSITWNNGITDGVSFAASSTTTYTATADDNGCSATDDVVVTVNPLPIVTIGADQTACENHDPIQLAGSPSGGSFMGPGVSGTEFDPSVAGEGVHTITYTYQDGNGCENSAVQVITVDGCASLNENSINNDITVKPNPATDYVDIVVKNVKSIRLMTSEGRIIDITSNVLNDNTSRIDVSDLSKGTYILQIQTENISTTRKVIIH